MGAPVVIEPPGLRSFSVGVLGLVVAAAATDILALIGGNSFLNKSVRLRIGGVATAATAVSMSLIRRSTANSGGTSTAPTPVPVDSVDVGAAKGSVLAYTANPAGLGTAVGTALAFTVPVGTASAPLPDTVIDFSPLGVGNPILRSALESLCLNLNGATVAGLTLNISVEWSETPNNF